MRLWRHRPVEEARVSASRAQRVGMSPLRAGAIALLLAVLATYFGFSKHIPFTHGFRLKAVFSSTVSIRKNSPVRIAGVNVGKVKRIERYGHSEASVVTMELDDRALPIHKDATLKIRPRIFLEGNFFVDVKPGTPSSPKVSDGDTVGMTQTATPVQLDEVLTSLQSDARQDLKDVLDGYGTALTHRPTQVEDADQDPMVRGRSAAEALNRTFADSPQALRGAAEVNYALLGTDPHDLSKLIASVARVAGALDRHEAQLLDLVTNLNATTGAFAAQAGNLQTSVRLLAPTLQNANRALTNLNLAFPPTRAFAREIIPGVRETPATITAALPWIRETRALVGPSELRGLVRQLAPTSSNLAALIDRSTTLLPQVDLVDRCFTDVVIPTGDVVIDDAGASNPSLHSGVENFKEFWYSLVGLSGEGQNFDANGSYVRLLPSGGSVPVATGKSKLNGEVLFGNAVSPPLGTRPKLGRKPPFIPSFPCYRNSRPNLNGPAAEIGPAETRR